MRMIFRIPSFSAQHDNRAAYEELVCIHPEGVRENEWWGMKLPEDDPRVKACMDCLARHGWKPWTQHYRPCDRQTEYSLDITREYDESDFAECRLLGLWPDADVWCHPERHEGRLRIYLPGESDRDIEFDRAVEIQGINCTKRLHVSDRVKRVLETAGIRNLVFKPTVAVPPPPPGEWKRDESAIVEWSAIGEPPWWELTSDLILPRMSPRAVVRDAKGNLITDDFTQGCYLKEALDGLDALIDPAEAKYRASDIEALGEFDLARSFEAFGHVWHDSGRDAIVSNRFYRLCRKHKIKVSFVPVRVHE